jgi:predicted ATPase
MWHDVSVGPGRRKRPAAAREDPVMAKRTANLPPPFLKEVRLREERIEEGWPFDLPILQERPFEIAFTRPITFLVGENGTGKSTLIEAIARHCGFNLGGGSRHNTYDHHTPEPALAAALRLSWLPKVTNGFFLRSESFFNFASYLETTEPEVDEPWKNYGGRPLHEVSHGQSMVALFANRLRTRDRAFYLLDEPEAALSPTRQLVFLELLRRWSCRAWRSSSSPRTPPSCWPIPERRSSASTVAACTRCGSARPSTTA